MRLSQAWLIAAKEFSILRKKRAIIISIILFPLLVAIGLPLIIIYISSHGVDPLVLITLLNSFSFFLLIEVVLLTTTTASYSLVGEKVEKSLEPLLATPTTEGEILMGKSIAAFIPPILSTYFSSIIFMVLMDLFTLNPLGYLYFPNWFMGVILFLMAPLGVILTIELNIIISTRVNDVRTAQQLGIITIAPLAVIYVSSEIGIIPLEIFNLMIISLIFGISDIILFYLSKFTFRREDILTRGK